MRPRLLPLFLFVLAFAGAGEGCRSAQFDPASKVESVRILATRADKPYAKPGEVVNLELLAYDGRRDKPAPMKLYWVPLPCIDPPSDSYYGCYPAFSQLPAGVDLAPVLKEGTTFTFTMPPDVITNHTKRNGSVDEDPSGLAVVFTIACAGHVEFIPHDPAGSVNALPLGCFDEKHNQLGPDDFVFAFSLIYAFDDRRNANPIVDHLTFGGSPVNAKVGITIDHCGSAAADANGTVSRSGCSPTGLDVVIPDSSQEDDPGKVDANGNPLKETVRVHYFVTDGKFDNDTINLFDETAGRITGTSDGYRAPATPGEDMIWAVVRDNRNGATWFSIPLHVR